MAEPPQLLPQLDVVVDLPVEHDHVATVRRLHGLRSCRRCVDDRETRVEEQHVDRLAGLFQRPAATLFPVGPAEPTGGVGAPMRDQPHDPAHEAAVVNARGGRDDAGEATHRQWRGTVMGRATCESALAAWQPRCATASE